MSASNFAPSVSIPPFIIISLAATGKVPTFYLFIYLLETKKAGIATAVASPVSAFNGDNSLRLTATFG